MPHDKKAELMSKKFKFASAMAKKKGFKKFNKGSAGASKRSAIAEAIGKKFGMGY